MTYKTRNATMRSGVLRLALLALLLALLLTSLSACSRFRYFRAGTQLYLAHNLWDSGEPGQIRSINFQKGTMLPAGTPVSRAAVSGPWIRFIANGRWHKVLVIPKYRPGIGAYTVAARLFTHKPFEELTKGFTEEEIQSIRAGAVGPGMSKDAVIVSWGYPPEHKTPSIAEDYWIYYRHRFSTSKVWFDHEKRVSQIKE